MRKPPYPLVYIEWDDSYGVSPCWEIIPKKFPTPKPAVCRSVGWLVYDGERHKVVVPHLTPFGKRRWDGCGDMAIPTAVIVKLIRLSLKG